MKKIFCIILATCLLLSTICFVACTPEQLSAGEGPNVLSLAERNLKRGEYMSKTMYNDFYDVDLGYAHRNVPAIQTESDIADCWRFTGMISMMIRLNELTNKKYTAEMDTLFDAFDFYKGYRDDNHLDYDETMQAGRGFTVFAVERSTLGKFNAFAYGTASVFDDQIWICREYLNAYKLYGKQEYLDTAIELAEYIYLVGWVPVVGGITWGQDYQTRHSCSNGPFVKVLVDLADAANRSEMQDWAKNVYDFMYTTLRDPVDNCYYDLVDTVYDGNNQPIGNKNIDKTKYTYNSGAMISAGVAMYNATGEQHYLDEAKATAEGCYNTFGVHDFVDGCTMYPVDTTTWFNLVMYIGFLDLYLADNSCDKYMEDLQRTIDYTYDNFGRGGYIPVAWLVGWENGWEKSDCKNLLDHSSHAETYLLLAQYQQAKAENAAK